MPSNESFQNLVNELTEEVLVKVQQQVQAVIADSVRQKLDQLVTPETVGAAVTSRVLASIENYQPDLSRFEEKIQTTTDNIAAEMNSRAGAIISEFVSSNLANFDVSGTAANYVIGLLDGARADRLFPTDSIPGSAIDKNTLEISGNNVKGGLIENFSSTGIEDRASSCQITVIDSGTIIENTLYSTRIEIKGDAVIDGDLIINGRIPEDSATYQNLIKDSANTVKQIVGQDMFDQYQDRVYERIATEGVVLDKIVYNGRSIIDGNGLTSAVLNSRLQTVGVLRDLQTEGETLLSETLYTSNKRVGVNTMDPATALSIWDEEIEIGIGKQQKNVARIATPRDHTLILGTNGNDNLKLMPEGDVAVSALSVGNVTFMSSFVPPSFDAKKGTIVFNENPSVGGPMGWVSLGNARWANFGIID